MHSVIRWVLVGVLIAAFTGCADSPVKEPTGSLSTTLIVAPGIDVTEINYEITGNGVDPITGVIAVTTTPVSAVIAGIPVGVGYTIKLFTTDGKCSGSTVFDVVANQTTAVTINIQCIASVDRGTADVEATIMLCPTITSVVVSPIQVDVGGTIYVKAVATDPSQGALTYAWTATASSFADASADATTYSCSVGGSQTLTIKASNVQCNDSISIDVVCNNAQPPPCGNGVVDAGETCDPPGQDCNDTCQYTGCVDQTGTWITHIVTTGTITAPVPVGKQPASTIDVVQRMYISRDNDNYVVRFDICSLRTVAPTVKFFVDYRKTVLATMNGTESIPYACYHLGDEVALPNFTINTGWGGARTPADCNCPDPQQIPYPPPEDPYGLPCCGAVDTDNDNVFGITLPTHAYGLPAFMAYAGLTLNVTLYNMKLTDLTTTSGTVSFPTTGYVFGSEAGASGNLSVATDTDTVPVTAIKLPGDVPCSEVIAHCAAVPCTP
jgi:hypothetical protein